MFVCEYTFIVFSYIGKCGICCRGLHCSGYAHISCVSAVKQHKAAATMHATIPGMPTHLAELEDLEGVELSLVEGEVIAVLTPVQDDVENNENGNGGRLPDVVAETKMLGELADDNGDANTETYWAIAIQVFIPFLVAGFGMVGAGLVLDVVQVRRVL